MRNIKDLQGRALWKYIALVLMSVGLSAVLLGCVAATEPPVAQEVPPVPITPSVINETLSIDLPPEPESEPSSSEIDMLKPDVVPDQQGFQDMIDSLNDELARSVPIGTHPIPADQRKIYYHFFRNNFDIRTISDGYRSWQSMSHNIHGEIRQTEAVYFNSIEGFDSPVLVIWEFPPNCYSGVGTAYLIKNSELVSALSRTEFNAIFREIDYRGFLAIHESESFTADINGENLINLRIRDEHGVGMDILLNWLSED